MEIKPQPGPQTAFLSSPADIAIYGGSAGGGKSYALLLHAMSIANVGSNAVLMRKTFPEIIQEGGLWDYAMELYLPLGAISKQSTELTFNFPSQGSVSFGHMQHEKDKYKWQGAQIACIGFDELSHFSKSQFFYMLSRNRDPKGKVTPHIRGTCNPDPDSWLAQFLSWWIGEDGYPIKERAGATRHFITVQDEIQWGDTKGELIERFGKDSEPKSVAFYPASIQDNQILISKDPGYIASLKALDEVDRARLLGGNWKAKRIGKLFKNPKFADWDFRYDSTAWVDTAFGGGNNTTLQIAINIGSEYIVIGFSWPESVIHLYDEFARLCKKYHVGTVTFESNADNGAAAREFRKFWPSVEDHPERENKHNKIVNYGVYNWGKIYIASEINQYESGRRWLSNLLAYEEKVEPDDEADGMASLIRSIEDGGPIAYNLGNLE